MRDRRVEDMKRIRMLELTIGHLEESRDMVCEESVRRQLEQDISEYQRQYRHLTMKYHISPQPKTI